LGTLTNNGTPIPLNQAVIVNSLSGLVYTGSATPGTDKIWLKAFNGSWNGPGVEADITDAGGAAPMSNQASAATAPASIAIGAGETIALGSASARMATFQGNTGTLNLDASSSLPGTVSGLRGQDVITLSDVGFGASTTLGYAANRDNSGGTLTVGDGMHTASLALLGSYMASSFAVA